MTATLAEQLSGFIADDKQEADENLGRLIRLAILDCLGVALCGRREPLPRIVREGFADTRREEATVWGNATRVACAEAAFANAVSAHALDYDLYIPDAVSQPAAVLIPAAVAVAECVGATVGAVVDAAALGLGLGAALGRTFGTDLHAVGWHPTSLLGAVAATGACARLLRLDRRSVGHALGIAASLASGLKANFGTMTKALQVGEAARRAVCSADLAAKGANSNHQALDEWLALLSGRRTGPLANLPGGFPVIAIKKYPCCARMHAALDACLNLRRSLEAPHLDGIVSVECWLHPRDIGHIDRSRVSTPEEAKFSLQYCAAVALVNGVVVMRDFDDPSSSGSAITRLMQSVHLVATPDVPSFGAEVRITVATGETRTRRYEAATRPSDAEVLSKFDDCCAAAGIDRAVAAELATAVLTTDASSAIGSVIKQIPVLE